jgi:CBS domain-containing protein
MEKSFLQMPVTSIMTRNITFISPDTIMDEVAAIFKGKSLHHLPVINQTGEIEGMISKSDYYKLLSNYTIFGRKDVMEKNKRFLRSLIAKDVMTKDVVCIHWDSKVETVIQIFLENLFHALPVVKEHKVIGIITPYDVLKTLVANPELIE